MQAHQQDTKNNPTSPFNFAITNVTTRLNIEKLLLIDTYGGNCEK